jgi:hypothetical protein
MAGELLQSVSFLEELPSGKYSYTQIMDRASPDTTRANP